MKKYLLLFAVILCGCSNEHESEPCGTSDVNQSRVNQSRVSLHSNTVWQFQSLVPTGRVKDLLIETKNGKTTVSWNREGETVSGVSISDSGSDVRLLADSYATIDNGVKRENIMTTTGSVEIRKLAHPQPRTE
jgi:hypothetical protein